MQLADAFALPRNILNDLGPGLAHALNWRTQRRSIVKVEASQKKGEAEFEKSLADIKSAVRILERAVSRLNSLHFVDPASLKDAELRSEVLAEMLKESLSQVRLFRRLLAINAKLVTSAYSEGIADKRLERDDRLSIVCTAIFRIRVASGRDLSFTTDHETSERRGALIDFVNAVVAMVTSPPAKLNGETLRLEIKRCKLMFEHDRRREELRPSLISSS